MQSVLLWFAIFGQDRYKWMFTPNHRLLSSILAISRMLFLTLNTLFIVSAIVMMQQYTSDGVVHFESFCILIPNTIGIVESWIYTKNVQFIVTNLIELFDYLKSSVRADICIDKFIRNYHWKLLFVVIVFSIEISLKLLLPSKYPIINNSDAIVSAASLYKYVATIHVAFFIESQSFILSTLNKTLNPISSDSAQDCLIAAVPVKQSMSILRHTKIIYHKIWSISDKINKRFGYFLLAALVNTVVHTIHIAMGIFVYLISEDSSTQRMALRKCNYLINFRMVLIVVFFILILNNR